MVVMYRQVLAGKTFLSYGGRTVENMCYCLVVRGMTIYNTIRY